MVPRHPDNDNHAVKVIVLITAVLKLVLVAVKVAASVGPMLT